MIENLTLQLNIVMPEVFSRASRVSVFSGFPPADCFKEIGEKKRRPL